MTARKPIIALDCDGVLLDYHEAYRHVWHRAFGYRPAIKDALAYHVKDRLDITWLSGEELAHFRSFFDDIFWSTMPDLPGALHACRLLAKHGFELVCVTAIQEVARASRLANLQHLGFPINRVISAPSLNINISPKAEIIQTLNPIAFVDDYLPYFRGVPACVHRALIMREPHGSPNFTSERAELVDATYLNLAEFAESF